MRRHGRRSRGERIGEIARRSPTSGAKSELWQCSLVSDMIEKPSRDGGFSLVAVDQRPPNGAVRCVVLGRRSGRAALDRAGNRPISLRLSTTPDRMRIAEGGRGGEREAGS